MKKPEFWLPIITILLLLGLWEAVVASAEIPPFILPPPRLIAAKLISSLIDSNLLRHIAFTLLEVLLGLFTGSITATIIGYFLAKSQFFERLIAPYLVASQAIPVVAIAPLLVIWFGPGLASKVLICALIVFFPVLINTVVGLRAVPENLLNLMYSMHATRGQILRYLEIPAALPIFLGGLRIGATLSVIGAVVGEFVGSDRGLGFLINIGRGQYDTALVFVAIIALVALALGLYGTVIILEKHFLSWQKRIRY